MSVRSIVDAGVVAEQQAGRRRERGEERLHPNMLPCSKSTSQPVSANSQLRIAAVERGRRRRARAATPGQLLRRHDGDGPGGDVPVGRVPRRAGVAVGAVTSGWLVGARGVVVDLDVDVGPGRAVGVDVRLDHLEVLGGGRAEGRPRRLHVDEDRLAVVVEERRVHLVDVAVVGAEEQPVVDPAPAARRERRPARPHRVRHVADHLPVAVRRALRHVADHAAGGGLRMASQPGRSR